MIRPGLVFVLWCAIAAVVVMNDVVGDTWIAATLSVRAVECYKALVPIPYVVMVAIIHARRTTGSQWFGAALLAALLWPASTMLAGFTYARATYEQGAEAFFDRLGFWWGAPYPLLVLTLFAAPLLAGWALAKRPS